MAFIPLKDFLSNWHFKLIGLIGPRAVSERVKLFYPQYKGYISSFLISARTDLISLRENFTLGKLFIKCRKKHFSKTLCKYFSSLVKNSPEKMQLFPFCKKIHVCAVGRQLCQDNDFS
jgi:hypothetical protein